ncbi:MAG: DUF58 domain-containing protein [Chloroflexota bacterium]|nr:DUF58 domain-containing protein [Chloroflexota bacterium]
MSSRLFTLVAATVIAWVMALNTGRDLAFNVAYLLTFVLAFSYAWAWSSLRGITLRRVTRTRRSQVGQYAEEQFEVSNRGRITKLWLEVKDESTLPWHEVSRVISNLVHNTSQRWQVRTLCTQRGRFRLGPLSLHSGDPLGIFQVEQRIETTGYMIVYPMVVDLASFEPSVSHLSGGEARHRRTYQITTNVAGVRDYAPGDSLNRIHWPTTARVRRLMAKEFELDPTADVWLYLDLNRMSEAGLPWTPAPPETGLFAIHSLRQKRTTFELPPITTEYAVSVTASLARYFIMRNRAVGLSCYGRNREFIQADRSERQLNKIMEALAVVSAAGDLPFAHLIATDGIRLNRNDTVLAVSADPNPEWAVALQHIQRRGVNSIAVVIDGGTFGRERDYASLLGELEAAGIASYRVQRGDNLEHVLSRSARGDAGRAPGAGMISRHRDWSPAEWGM